MKQQKFIQKFLALVLLMVFSVSATPKAYFHELFAHHKDDAVVCHHPEPGSFCVHSQPINCHFNDLVVTAPFLIQKEQYSFDLARVYFPKNDEYKSVFVPSYFSCKTGRAPPVA